MAKRRIAIDNSRPAGFEDLLGPIGVLENKCYVMDCMHNSRSRFTDEDQWGLCVLDAKVTNKYGHCGSYESDFWFILNYRKQVTDEDGRDSFIWTFKSADMKFKSKKKELKAKGFVEM